MHAFNQSLKYDQRMHAADIRGSIAYAKALARVGILTRDEEAKMIEGLQAVGREWDNGQVSDCVGLLRGGTIPRAIQRHCLIVAVTAVRARA
jgi:hypothetical protein